MAVIHVPPKACPLCAEYEDVTLVPPAGTTCGKTCVREPRRRLEIPFLQGIEWIDRPAGERFPEGAVPWRLGALSLGI